MVGNFLRKWLANESRPRIIVLGNEKGGSGKSTIAIHLAMGLQKQGFYVGTIDLDCRQATLSNFIKNRKRLRDTQRADLRVPEHRLLREILLRDDQKSEDEQARWFTAAIEGFSRHDAIVVDTPGNNTFLSRAAHILADTLITPVNDSLIDLDVLVRLDLEAQKITGPSIYSELVLYLAEQRANMRGAALDWIIMRTRLAQLDSRNSSRMEFLLKQLAPRLGFHLACGFSERVVFRELFHNGLTVLDLPEPGRWTHSRRTHTAARNEIDELLDIVNLVKPARKEAALDAAPLPGVTAHIARQTQAETKPKVTVDRSRLGGLDTRDRVGAPREDDDLLHIPAFLRRQAN